MAPLPHPVFPILPAIPLSQVALDGDDNMKAGPLALAVVLGMLGLLLLLGAAYWAVGSAAKRLQRAHAPVTWRFGRRSRSVVNHTPVRPETPHPEHRTFSVYQRCRDAGPARQAHLSRLPAYSDTDTLPPPAYEQVDTLPPTMPPPSYGSWRTLRREQTHPTASTDSRTGLRRAQPSVGHNRRRHHSQSQRVRTTAGRAGPASHGGSRASGRRERRWWRGPGYLPAPGYHPFV